MNPSPGFKKSLIFFEGALVIMNEPDSSDFNALDGVRDLLGMIDLSLINEHNPIEGARELHHQIQSNERRAPRMIAFAVDAFGNLFAEDQHGVVFAINAEIAQITQIWINQWAWAKSMAHDSAGFSGRVHWREVMTLCDFQLDASVRLIPALPLVFGGTKEAANLVPLPLADVYTHYAHVASTFSRACTGDPVTWSPLTTQKEITHV